MRRVRTAIIIFVLINTTAVLPAQGDWINLSGAQSARNIAEIHVREDHVRLSLEIYVGDLDKFVDLLPDDFLKTGGVTPPPMDVRMGRFSTEGLRITADGGPPLVPRLEKAEPRMRTVRPNLFAGTVNPYTGQPVPGPPEDKRVLFVDLVYKFASRPNTLTFSPPFQNGGFPAVSMGFIAYHGGVPIVDYRYLSERATLHLDWEDPWYSRFENKAFKRWQQSGVMTYLYIEPYEVRHETLVRVKDLANWMDLGLRGDTFIEADEVASLKKRAGVFLLKHSNVLIDGKQRPPILDRTSFVKYTMTRIFFIDQAERMPLNTAMLGVIVTYLTDRMPGEVTVAWDLFSDRIQTVPASAVDPAGPFPSFVTPDDNVLRWKNFLKTYQMPTVAAIDVDDALTRVKIPVASVLCGVGLACMVMLFRSRRKNGRSVVWPIVVSAVFLVGGFALLPYARVAVARPALMIQKMDDAAAVTVLENLLKNIYRSFDFRQEADVYDRLATSVSGDLLATIYLQNRRSMVVTQAGGAQARVKAVEILDVSVENIDGRPLSLLFHARWTAMGTVGHWGHIHSRKNRYEANITVEPVEGTWKITGLELIDEKRIDPYARPETG